MTTAQIHVLLVDDDIDLRLANQRYLERKGYSVMGADDGETALELAKKNHFDAVVLDLGLPRISGLDVLKLLKEFAPDCEVLMLTGSSDVPSAVEAMKRGAFDFLVKPTSMAVLEASVEKAAEHARLRHENQQLRSMLERNIPQRKAIVGNAPKLTEAMRLIHRVASTDKPVLILGETGTGKELAARAVHDASPFADKMLVTINCAALPEHLLESELFGHEKGAFTGALATKPGLFETADGGSLFLDEMGDLPGPLQAKLLRVLEDGSMRRVGSVKERRVKVRIIAATNKDLSNLVKDGKFREDLFYRINVLSVELPPLRDRREDIPLLVRHFLGPEWTIEDDALQALETYSWPGNIRQLINVIDRAKILAEEKDIYLDDLSQDIQRQNYGVAPPDIEADDLRGLQRAKVLKVLSEENDNKARAAKRLGIGRRSLYRLLEKYADSQ